MFKKTGLFLFFPLMSSAAPLPADLCSNLLSILNRPTVADSVCVVKNGEKVIEGGLQFQQAYPGDGQIIVFPQMQARFGLPYSLEFTLLPSSYIQTFGSDDNVIGYTATTTGLNQAPQLGHWIVGAETLLTLPMGDADFGSDGFGIAVNGIVEYNFTAALSLTLMMGVTSQTQSHQQGGERFTSFNPDLVFAWQPHDDIQLYAEIYGQTKTNPDESSGFNGDLGLQYLILDYVEIDIEYGQRFSGELGGFSSYVGAGGAVMF